MLVQRERMRKLASLGSRVGYVALLVAVVAFLLGVLNDLPGWSVALVVGGFAVATACLVPAIILGYAVKAAAREDRERARSAPEIRVGSGLAHGPHGRRPRRRPAWTAISETAAR